MNCPKCGSSKVNVQVVVESKLKNKHHSLIYWIFIGWWLYPILWICLTLPMIFFKLFGHKKQRIVQNQKSMAVCQDCGYHWNT